MVDDPATDAIVSWGPANNSFVVWNTTAFGRDLVPKYFKHNDFSSFSPELFDRELFFTFGSFWMQFLNQISGVILSEIWKCLMNSQAWKAFLYHPIEKHDDEKLPSISDPFWEQLFTSSPLLGDADEKIYLLFIMLIKGFHSNVICCHLSAKLHSRCDWSEVGRQRMLTPFRPPPLLVPKLLHSTRKWCFSSINEEAQEIDHKFQVSDKTKSAFGAGSAMSKNRSLDDHHSDDQMKTKAETCSILSCLQTTPINS
ncbi:hypothetical protein OPV22_018764 [Ensete ventricosum]|uniref:HSF-type DNA-binding domain-containing protein n=1 Tax=Ensete ventricosum TaxID=4639 RepID=A0AAV8QR70_ENSVE|nr:hypothetical protein OPV22_018764 [Ensete ventricosum]